MEKEYICECGKVFNNPQSFNGHKSLCKEHYLYKYGNLDRYNTNRDTFIRNANKGSKQNSVKCRNKKAETLTIWLEGQHKCESCGKTMTEFYGSGRFCCQSCANSKSHSKETKKKISESIRKKHKNKVKKFCKLCNKELKRDNKTGYCASCLRTAPELKEFRIQQGKRASSFIKNHWPPRNQISYPEKFFTKVLDNNSISYIHDQRVRIDDKHWYYLDFYIEKNGNKIDLEIDGKQHKYPDRQQSDLKRNKDLSNLGYLVYRIEWNEINSEHGKNMMKEKIDSFLQFYSCL